MSCFFSKAKAPPISSWAFVGDPAARRPLDIFWQVWDVATKKILFKLGGHHAFTTKDCPFLILAAQSTADPFGDYVCSGSEEHRVFVWHLRHRLLLSVLKVNMLLPYRDCRYHLKPLEQLLCPWQAHELSVPATVMLLQMDADVFPSAEPRHQRAEIAVTRKNRLKAFMSNTTTQIRSASFPPFNHVCVCCLTPLVRV